MTKAKYPNGLRAAFLAFGTMTASELARRINTSRQNVQRWMDGERKLPREVAIAIAPLLGTTAGALLLLPDESPRQMSAEFQEVQTLSAKLPPEELDDVIAALLERRAALDPKEAAPARREKRKAILK